MESSHVTTDVCHIQSDRSQHQTDAFTNQNDASAIQAEDFFIQSDVSAVQADAFTIQTDVSAIQADAFTIQTDVSAIQAEDFFIQSDVSVVQTDALTIQTDISAIQADSFTIRTDISAIQADAFTIQTDDAFSIHTDESAIHADAFTIQTDSILQAKAHCIETSGTVYDIPEDNLIIQAKDLASEELSLLSDEAGVQADANTVISIPVANASQLELSASTQLTQSLDEDEEEAGLLPGSSTGKIRLQVLRRQTGKRYVNMLGRCYRSGYYLDLSLKSWLSLFSVSWMIH